MPDDLNTTHHPRCPRERSGGRRMAKQDAESVKGFEVFDSSRNFTRATSRSNVSRDSPAVGPQERASRSARTTKSLSDFVFYQELATIHRVSTWVNPETCPDQFSTRYCVCR